MRDLLTKHSQQNALRMCEKPIAFDWPHQHHFVFFAEDMILQWIYVFQLIV